mmetsp:Transcript_1061/g.2312  ORF Transcript_1061/g.2312 Transcript_1061/m.2312 type:complete len:339 (+) Transcript_1061:324-1340(+)
MLHIEHRKLVRLSRPLTRHILLGLLTLELVQLGLDGELLVTLLLVLLQALLNILHMLHDLLLPLLHLLPLVLLNIRDAFSVSLLPLLSLPLALLGPLYPLYLLALLSEQLLLLINRQLPLPLCLILGHLSPAPLRSLSRLLLEGLLTRLDLILAAQPCPLVCLDCLRLGSHIGQEALLHLLLFSLLPKHVFLHLLKVLHLLSDLGFAFFLPRLIHLHVARLFSLVPLLKLGLPLLPLLPLSLHPLLFLLGLLLMPLNQLLTPMLRQLPLLDQLPRVVRCLLDHKLALICYILQRLAGCFEHFDLPPRKGTLRLCHNLPKLGVAQVVPQRAGAPPSLLA